MADEVNTEVTETTDNVEQSEVPATFTEKDLQSAKDSAYDKARNDLLKTFEDEKAKAIAQAKADALAESKMTAEQKAQKELNDKLKALEQREAGIKQRELTADVTTQLSTAGLPVDLAEKLVSLGDKEASQAFIDSITSAIQEQTNAEIKKRANAGKPNGTASTIDTTKLTAKDFNTMSAAERVALSKTNPEIFKQITGA